MLGESRYIHVLGCRIEARQIRVTNFVKAKENVDVTHYTYKIVMDKGQLHAHMQASLLS